MVTMLLIGVFSSCKTSKGISKTSTTVDSTSLKEAYEKIKTLTQERNTYYSKIRELEYLGVSFQDCPEINIDSLRNVLKSGGCKQSTVDSLINLYKSAQTTIKKLADGTLEIKGKIGYLTQSKSKDEETLMQKDKTITELKEALKREKANVKTVTVTKDKVKKTSFLNQWWLFPLGFITCLFIVYRKKILTIIKN